MARPREAPQAAAAADAGAAVPTPPNQVAPEQAAPAPDPAQPPAPGEQAPAPDEHGPQLAYFAIRVGGEDGKAVGLFRVADDEEAQALTLERFTPTGEWEDDPGLIDELHEPGCFSVDENEAQTIESQILAVPQ